MIKTNLPRRFVALCLTIFTAAFVASGLANKAADATAEVEGARLFESAPRDSKGRFTNRTPNLSKGSTALRMGFFLRRFGTYFRSHDGVVPT